MSKKYESKKSYILRKSLIEKKYSKFPEMYTQ